MGNPEEPRPTLTDSDLAALYKDHPIDDTQSAKVEEVIRTIYQPLVSPDQNASVSGDTPSQRPTPGA